MQTRIYIFIFKLLCCLLLIPGSNGIKAQSRKPNIIWITCEDISPFIGAYGNRELKTPHIDKLASEGISFTRAYTTAGVCAPSRSALITGMYQTSIGTHHMRTIGDPKYQPVPSYSAVIPEYVKCFPEYLRQAGYYCTNNMKQDYQFVPPVTVWDENGPAASYRNRPAGKPFFAIFNLAITHESMLFLRNDSLRVDPRSLKVPPIYPDTRKVREGIARLYTNIEIMDEQVGEIISMLKADGLYDSTIIFFYSDHGGALPWMKREILERGTHIPLIIRFPKGKDGGTVNEELISAVDFAPTVLSLADVKIPSHIQGEAFLGAQKVKSPRKYIFAARDRMDTEYDRVRMVKDKRFRYVYNYMPEKPYYQEIEFRLAIPMMKEIMRLKDEGKLNALQLSWFNTKPVEELYDVDNDPYELHNLAGDPAYEAKLKELRSALQDWTKKFGDLGNIPEKEMIRQMWDGKDGPQITAQPEIIQNKKGIKLSCATKGASIGYRILQQDSSSPQTSTHVIESWDFGFLNNAARKGQKQVSTTPWLVYHGETIQLRQSDTLQVNAMRIGFKPVQVRYSNGSSVVEKPEN